MWHTWEGREKCTGFWWGKPEGKRQLGRPRHRWDNGIRMDLREPGWQGIECIQLAQDRDWWQAL
jgi:hypothetical protein